MSHLVEAHGFELVAQGAEARLYAGAYLGRPTMIKERFGKAYRHPALDATLTRERTRAEAKSILKALAAGVRASAVYYVDHDAGRIYMERFADALTVKRHIGDVAERAKVGGGSARGVLASLSAKIGRVVARLHESDIVHGDLTTSNLLLAPPPGVKEFEPDAADVVVIDFGLSRVDPSAEDKGVDLYVLERALTSAHSTLPGIFDDILEAYAQGNERQAAEVVAKLNEIRARGRKRTMVG